MKNVFKSPIKALIFVFIFFSLSSPSLSQELFKLCNLTAADLKIKFSVLGENADLKLLRNELTAKGWTKLDDDGAAYGATGTYKDKDGKSASFEFYVFDFYNKSTGQTGALIWKNNGRSIYKAYLLFPPGEKDFDKALEGSVEMYAEGGKIQKASSWGRCYKKCIRELCPSACVGSAIVCGIATVPIILASGGNPFSMAFWFGCVGMICSTCCLACALDCR